MLSTTKPSRAAQSRTGLETGAEDGTIDWRYFDRVTSAILAAQGITPTNAARADLAGLSLRTYYNYRSGQCSPTLIKLADIAACIGTTSFRLIGGRAR